MGKRYEDYLDDKRIQRDRNLERSKQQGRVPCANCGAPSYTPTGTLSYWQIILFTVPARANAPEMKYFKTSLKLLNCDHYCSIDRLFDCGGR